MQHLRGTSACDRGTSCRMCIAGPHMVCVRAHRYYRRAFNEMIAQVFAGCYLVRIVVETAYDQGACIVPNRDFF